MYSKKLFYFITPVFLSVLVHFQAQAQQTDGDSLLQSQTIDIYNVYQPSLPEAAKIDLNTTLPDTKKENPNLIYTIPSQNLNFSYSPIPLQPLAIGIDTSKSSFYNNYIKAGFGNHSSPLLRAGLSNGEELPLQYGADFSLRSAKGALKDQKFSETKVLLYGKYFSPSHVYKAELGYNLNGIRYYGYDHADMTKRPEDIKQNFSALSFKIGLENKEENDLQLNYQPKLGFSHFSDKFQRNENSISFDLPVQKLIVEDIYLSAELKADLSSFKEGGTSINNNLVSIHPAVEIEKEQFKLHAGVNPTWSKGKFYLLPDIVNETHLIKDHLILSSGWTSHVNKNSYQNIASENPFIGSYTDPLNTRIDDRYTGLKGSIDERFTYNTKFSFLSLHDRVLYLNDPLEPYKFNMLSEPSLKAFEFHAEVGYSLGELFKTKLSGSWFNYHDLREQEEAWGLRPFESDLLLQYGGIERLNLSANIFVMAGSWYKDDLENAQKTKGAFDVNLGGSYDIGDRFNVWLNLDNLFNNHYQRWNRYSAIGFNIMAGILLKF